MPNPVCLAIILHFGYCWDDEMTSQELPSRESSTHGTYKPIGERFAYEGIPPYANLSLIGLYVSHDEDSLEGCSP